MQNLQTEAAEKAEDSFEMKNENLESIKDSTIKHETSQENELQILESIEEPKAQEVIY